MLKQYPYDLDAQYYDVMDAQAIPYAATTRFLDKLIRFKGKKVLDLACGTGNFTQELKRHGAIVEGADISQGMLKVAKAKLKGVRFYHHDMRKPLPRKYDATLCMFNAVAHLTKDEFAQTLKQLRKTTGVLVFDIFNFSFMDKHFRAHPFIDEAREMGDLTIVRFNDNRLDRKKHIMHINQRTYIQKNYRMEEQKISWDMQIYTLTELEELLAAAGFSVKRVYGGFGPKGLLPYKPDGLWIVVVAQ